ncbi:MAG: YciI family protein [Collimonas pratensis]|uniref:YciI family protein n=1 Tax=Collimonas pratensis TaxID=279113 RepID=UPI003C78EC32
MKFLMTLYADEAKGAAIPAAEMAKYMEQMYAYRDALIKAGVFVQTNGLATSTTACTVSTEGGQIRVHDGPYADTREQAGGYFIIDAKDPDEARLWATRCPAATWGIVELRQIVEHHSP